MAEMGPLSIALNIGEIKTAIPLVAQDTYAKYKFMGVKEGQSDKGKFLQFEYHLLEPVPNSDGGQITPGELGSKLFETVQLYAKPDAVDQQWFLRKIATRVDALLGTGDPGNSKGKPPRPEFNAECIQAMIGQVLIAKMKITTYEGTSRNEFATVHFPADIAV